MTKNKIVDKFYLGGFFFLWLIGMTEEETKIDYRLDISFFECENSMLDVTVDHIRYISYF